MLHRLAVVDENSKEESTKQQVNNGTANWAANPPNSSESNASPSPCEEQKTLLQENSQLLQALTTYIVKQNRYYLLTQNIIFRNAHLTLKPVEIKKCRGNH